MMFWQGNSNWQRKNMSKMSVIQIFKAKQKEFYRTQSTENTHDNSKLFDSNNLQVHNKNIALKILFYWFYITNA